MELWSSTPISKRTLTNAVIWTLAVAFLALAFSLLAPRDGAIGQTKSDEMPEEKGIEPIYPADRECSELTSLYLSWIDVDGSRRDEQHTGVDGGTIGDPILAPAGGVVIAVWRADWSWGPEGALLIRHTREDVGLQDGPPYYYSEFDHLRYDQIRSIPVGKKVNRGDRLATVSRPGGDPQYPPEVHWEVASIEDESATEWAENKFGAQYWKNTKGKLVDPLSLFSLGADARTDGKVVIVPFDRKRDYSSYRGFTYILPCPMKKKARGSDRQNRQR